MEQPNGTIVFTVSARRLAKVLLALVLFLVIAHLVFALNYHRFGYDFFGATQLYVLFDLHGEVTIPTWYSSSLLLFSALILALIAIAKQRVRDSYRLHWAGLSLMFLALSIDEAADVHGAVSYRLQTALDTSGPLTYAWVIPASVIALLVALVYLRFMVHLPPAIRLRFLLAGGLFVGGALGLEVIEAAYDSAGGGDSVLYLIMVALEEALEMSGVIVFIAALLAYLRTLAPTVSFTITTAVAADSQPDSGTD